MIGAARIDVFGVKLGVGFAVGLLLVGLGLGLLQRIGPVRTQVPREARQLVRDLGILLFVGETGLVAGSALGTAPEGMLLRSLCVAIAVNVLTIGAALVLARGVLRLRPVDAWGCISGGLTSAAALHTVRRVADSNEPAISYAAAYAAGSVLATIAGPIVIMSVS